MFTKRKFLNFPVEQQHKKCAELLRVIYNGILLEQPIEPFLSAYNQIQEWLVESPLHQEDLKMIGDRYHRHLNLAKISLREHNFLPSIRKGDKKEKESIWPVAIYLDKIRSAHNVGSIIRTVEAFSLGKLYFSKGTPFIDHKQVKDASMGTYELVHCFRSTELDELPKPIIAMETSCQATSIYEFIFPSSFTLVLGNEEYGCSDETLKQADFLIEIPLRGRKNSLNVANAFAVAAAEIQRQKIMCKGKS